MLIRRPCRRMQEAGWKVATAWALASACVLGHLPHWWRGAPHLLHRLASPHLHAALSAVALLGAPSRPSAVQLTQLSRQAVHASTGDRVSAQFKRSDVGHTAQ